MEMAPGFRGDFWSLRWREGTEVIKRMRMLKGGTGDFGGKETGKGADGGLWVWWI